MKGSFLGNVTVIDDRPWRDKVIALNESIRLNSSGNRCKQCGGPLAKYSSLNTKQCYDCGKQYDWKLKPKQQPLVKYQR
jgi:uncharacterized protein with PIN domain